jgi:transposase
MLTVDDYARIRRAYRDGMSLREMERTFHHSRKTIRRVLRGEGEPGPYPKRRRQSAPQLGRFHARILEILKDDETQPPKQRHTRMRIFERLRDEEGYSGGYDAVRRFVNRHLKSRVETFIPLDHRPGQRIEADFGEISVDFPEGRRKVNVLILVWSYSNLPFAIALPTQRTEAILEGMTQAFDFFGHVPEEVWWDNPKTVAEALLSGRSRKINPRYQALASHYVFEPLFCMPARGNEKPVVENRVKTLERKWSTPVPRVKDMEELNAYLRACCLKEHDRCSSGQTQTIGERFAEEKRRAAPLPGRRFDPCIRQAAKVNKYQFARFDNVNYSVPRQAAFQTVTVKGYVDRVEIVLNETVIAVHARSYDAGDDVLDPLHYLTTLERRPAALDHSNVYRDWKLPKVFGELRERLEQRHGPRAGVRQFVRVLQLLAEHPLSRVQSAIEQLRGPEGADAERIIRRVEASAARLLETSSESVSTPLECDRSDVLSVQVPCPNLSHFDQFLSSSLGDSDHVHEPQAHGQPDAAQGQSQTTQAAHDPGRARETGPRSERHESNLRAIPAPADRTGGGGPADQCLEQPDSQCQLSCGEGLGGIQLPSDARPQQADNLGTRPWGMDLQTFQYLLSWSTGHWKDARQHWIGPGRVPGGL